MNSSEYIAGYTALERSALSEATLRAGLITGDGLVTDLRVRDETDSTNDDVVDLARSGAGEGTIEVAEYQRAGRGRLDRSWSCPPRAGLTFSLVLRPDGVPDRRWGWLPLLTGCAVAGGISDVAGLQPRLKWPNDVLLEIRVPAQHGASQPAERKVCGILAQRVETPSGPAAVVGVGVNVSVRSEELAVPTATSLAMAGATSGSKLDRERLLQSIVEHLTTLYRRWHADAGAAHADERTSPDEKATVDERGTSLADAYRARCSTIGRDVRVRTGADEWVEGRAVDIDTEGRLVVATATREVACRAGDVLHVR